MSERAEPSQSSGTSPDGSSPGEVVAEEWSDCDDDEHVFGVSNDPATHGVADAAELLALREALSEKELQILEMRQSMADEEEENARTLTSARKELAAKVRESAVRAKAKIRILRSELKAAREAAETEREASAAERAAAASAREEMATYREKWMDEKRAAAVAEAVAEKAKEHVALAREERAEAREERDAARRETLEKTRELHALRESTEPARLESQAAVDEAREPRRGPSRRRRRRRRSSRTRAKSCGGSRDAKTARRRRARTAR